MTVALMFDPGAFLVALAISISEKVMAGETVFANANVFDIVVVIWIFVALLILVSAVDSSDSVIVSPNIALTPEAGDELISGIYCILLNTVFRVDSLFVVIMSLSAPLELTILVSEYVIVPRSFLYVIVAVYVGVPESLPVLIANDPRLFVVPAKTSTSVNVGFAGELVNVVSEIPLYRCFITLLEFVVAE
jgi:hypothetical protein